MPCVAVISFYFICIFFSYYVSLRGKNFCKNIPIIGIKCCFCTLSYNLWNVSVLRFPSSQAIIFPVALSTAFISHNLFFWLNKMPHLVKLYFCYIIAYSKANFQKLLLPINKWWMYIKNLCKHTKRSFTKRIKKNTQPPFCFYFFICSFIPFRKMTATIFTFLTLFMIHFTAFYIFIWSTLFTYWHNNISFYFFIIMPLTIE